MTDSAPSEVTPKEIFLSQVKSRDVFPLLILHLVRKQPEYGNSLMHGLREMTSGVMSVSPNTVYPLLRRMEEKGYITGEWENLETRNRRFYTITLRGEQKYEEIREPFREHLTRLKNAIESLESEIYD